MPSNPTFHIEMIQDETNTVKINTDLIPDHVRDDLATIALNCVREYFKEPGVQEKYERWLEERRSRNAKEAKIWPVP